MHTQLGFQITIPEAIAIVISPSNQKKKHFMYNLTIDGLNIVGKCKRTGFHPHTTKSCLFAQAEHVSLTKNGSNLKIVDFRTNDTFSEEEESLSEANSSICSKFREVKKICSKFLKNHEQISKFYFFHGFLQF